MTKQTKQAAVVVAIPAAKPQHIKAIASFDASTASAKTALVKALKGASALDVVLAVASHCGHKVKKGSHHLAKTEWVLDSAAKNYERAKTLLRDVKDAIGGKESRGKAQARKAANKVKTAKDVYAMYLELDAKERAAFRKMAGLAVAK